MVLLFSISVPISFLNVLNEIAAQALAQGAPFLPVFDPRLLGVSLIINGFAYVVLSATALLLPQYSNTVRPFALPFLFGEMAVMLWLLIMGVKARAPEASAG